VFDVIGHPDRRAELPARLERHARLGIREYVVVDPSAGSVAGWQLDPAGRYVPMIEVGGLLRSDVLGIELPAARMLRQ
jgi:Uma2 family endonuclease